jgi:hypothetical protein
LGFADKGKKDIKTRKTKPIENYFAEAKTKDGMRFYSWQTSPAGGKSIKESEDEGRKSVADSVGYGFETKDEPVPCQTEGESKRKK